MLNKDFKLKTDMNKDIKDTIQNILRTIVTLVFIALIALLAGKLFNAGITGSKENPLTWILLGIILFILAIPLSLFFAVILFKRKK